MRLDKVLGSWESHRYVMLGSYKPSILKPVAL